MPLHREQKLRTRNGLWASSIAPAWASHVAWPPNARTTPPMPAGTTSLRKTRQRPRRWATSWERRHSRFFPSEARRSQHVSSIAPCTKSVVELFSHITYVFFTVIELNIELAALAAQKIGIGPQGCVDLRSNTELHVLMN